MVLAAMARRICNAAMALGLAAVLASAAASGPAAVDPIRIGLSISLTGPTAPAGQAGARRAGNLARRRQRQGRPARPAGGTRLLRRPGQPGEAPGIYAKLMSVDKVDLLIGPYSTKVIAAAMPAIMQAKPHHHRHFRARRQQAVQISEIFLDELAGAVGRPTIPNACSISPPRKTPKPVRVALVGADVEYSRKALDGARENAKAMGFEIVFERTYPLSTTEFTPIVRAMQAANPDVVFGATLPVDTAGIIAAAKEIQFKPKMIGGAMLGLLVTADQAEARAADQRLYQQRVLHPGAEPAVRRHRAISARSIRSAPRRSASIRSATPIRPMPMRPGKSSPRR